MLCFRAGSKDVEYKNGKYPHYFEVHSPMGNMRLRADDASAKTAWISSLEKQAQVYIYIHCAKRGSISAAGPVGVDRETT